MWDNFRNMSDSKPPRIDDLDRRLVVLVQSDSSLSYAELGRQVGLSVSAVNERVRKLERAGIVRGYSALVDAQAIGLDVCAFVRVTFAPSGDEAMFRDRVLARDEVMECHHVAGDDSYLLKVRTTDTAALETLTAELVWDLPGVTGTRTGIVLSTVKETSALPATAV